MCLLPGLGLPLVLNVSNRVKVIIGTNYIMGDINA